uniref:Replicase n=1 Tax=Manly virus TaxID=2485873 RepID=A0A3G3BTN7_9VIRU|nr:RNA-dependent RNA polymerase [Manly virus]
MAAYEDYSLEEIPGPGDDWGPEFFELGEDVTYPITAQEKIKLSGVLNSTDYNLNSPLIRDHSDAILKGLRGQGKPGRFLRNEEIERQISSLHHLPCDWTEFSAGSGFHSWLPEGVYQKGLSCRHLSSLWSQNLDENVEAMSVVQDFWLHLTGTELGDSLDLLKGNWRDVESIGSMGKRLVEDGEAYWFFHVLTLLMNSNSETERDSLLLSTHKMFQVTLRKDGPTKFCFSGIHSDFGRFHVGPGVVLLEEPGRLFDRNMILMIKDTMVARFCTKLSLIKSLESSEDISRLKRLTELYQLGDEILACKGNDVFDILQLLEPFCNERLSELASSARPLIPRSLKFREFLTQEILKLELRCRGLVTPFFGTISAEKDYRQVLIYFGCFRHWGHPFIDYLQGLRKLHSQVTLEKVIDESYAKALASDLAYIVLKNQFDNRKKWFVNSELMTDDHPLFEHVINCTWPTPAQIQDMGDIWADLPIIPCFEIPPSIDPSVLYADKSHSPNRQEVLNHVARGVPGPIPSKKVLQTALGTPQRDLKEFLTEVNDKGLPWDSLVIGLKGKEREIKKVGRFFSLMSWDLREYFVSTEYLIKTYFVPLFHGLTMADDLKALTKKMIESSIGHGHDDYKIIGFANHLDYEKWNNHQRRNATSPVFTVMGRFFGLPNLFSRTHEFFENSLIYYGERPDLMRVEGRVMKNKTGDIVCWEGQAGGLEGLRQKGWSVLNLLVILREAKVRNTRVRTLAQGDNQVICTQYRIPEGLDETSLIIQLDAASKNNFHIMEAIIRGTEKLGLIINQKETLISSDYLAYGKVPVFRGNIEPVESKKYSRVTCVPNDQVPSLGNAIAAVATNSLTVAQFSRSVRYPMINYCMFSCLILTILRFHSPLLKGPLLPENTTKKTKKLFTLRALYLDPSLGGVSGMSLTRFLIRMFPDPITEGLSFWRVLYLKSPSHLVKELAIHAGYPKLARPSVEALSKLIEKPSSLNVPKGLSATTLLRNEIRKSLTQQAPTIKNKLVAQSLIYLRKEESRVLLFLKSVQPLFPRFLSEFYAATFLGITESVVSLFQNSRTIRTVFSGHFSREVGKLIRKSELMGVRVLTAPLRGLRGMWNCSSTHADKLRRMSWGEQVYGTTVPHPLEMLSSVSSGTSLCKSCMKGSKESDHVSVCYPHGLDISGYKKGKLCAYLGSNTMESTSLLMPWEKEVKIPLLERASKLRSAINWFVESNSKLASSILENLKSLTGLDWKEDLVEYSRTGSALHRFYSSRQSNGGFASTSPSSLSWILVTTDTMTGLADQNHDFMYQSTLLYSQLVSLERNFCTYPKLYQHHFHIGCRDCIREIQEITLESQWVLSFPSVHEVVSRMSGGLSMAFSSISSLPVARGDWSTLSTTEQCFHVGVAQGALFGFLCSDNDAQSQDSSIFPSNLASKLCSLPYLMGILKGLCMAATYSAVYRRSTMRGEPRSALIGGAYYLIEQLCDTPGFISYLNSPNFIRVLTSIHHRIAPSYPPSARHLGALGKGYLHYHVLHDTLTQPLWSTTGQTLWIFSDFRTPRLSGLMILSHRLWEMLKDGHWTKKICLEVVEIKNIISYFCSRDRLHLADQVTQVPNLDLLKSTTANTRWCPSEVRHAVRAVVQDESLDEGDPWGPEWTGYIKKVILNFSSFPGVLPPGQSTPRINDPLISGLRPFQFATGAHYKLRSILKELPPVRGFLCGGDGSGGMTAAILRCSRGARGIFNSLLDLTDRHLRGVAPGPPSAVAALPPGWRDRCVNWRDCWKDPSDLSLKSTWDHFVLLKSRHGLNLNLLVFDMEVISEEMSEAIESHLRDYLYRLLDLDGCLVYKMYGTREEKRNGEGIGRLGCLFKSSWAVTTEITSTHSSEFYLVGRDLIQTKITATYLCPQSLQETLSSLPANSSFESEFDRACRLKPEIMLEGIPSNLIPSGEVEFTALFSELGLETGVAAHFASLLAYQSTQRVNPLGLILTGLILLSNSIVNTTRWVVKDYSPPSDQRLQRLLSAFIGTWEFCAWLYQAVPIGQRTRYFLEKPVFFYYNVTPRASPSRVGMGLEWDWFTPQWSSKRLIKAEHPATIGQVIRVWTRFWTRRQREVPQWPELRETIYYFITAFNKGIHPDDILHHTGLFYPIYGLRIFRKACWKTLSPEDRPIVSTYPLDPWALPSGSWSS